MSMLEAGAWFSMGIITLYAAETAAMLWGSEDTRYHTSSSICVAAVVFLAAAAWVLT